MLLKFKILNPEEMQQVDGIDYSILINIDQIVTIKSITIMYQGNLIDGHWIRTTNGKKYKATRIPKSIESLLNETNSNDLSDIKLNKEKSIEKQESYLTQ